MKKRLIIILTFMLTIISVNGSMNIKAMEDSPAFLITDEYIIIEHKKYDLVDNKIIYGELEYELVDSNLIAYDTDGVLSIIGLPVEANRIKDEDRINELNRQVGISSDGKRSIPSSTVNLPYSKTLPSGSWSAESPYVNINVPGQTYWRVTNLKITNMPLFSTKRFAVNGIYGDVAGNWYDFPRFNDYDFGKNNTIKIQNFTSTRYGKFFMACLYGEPSFTYTISLSQL